MLTKEEKDFIIYWEQNRDNQKRFGRQLMIGLPVATLFVIAIAINFVAGWYKRAYMVMNSAPSLIPVLIIAGLAITVFIAVFSVKHKWEVNEQHYRELKAKTGDDGFNFN